MNISYPVRVAELFAGVGGFRLGLERVVLSNDRRAYEIVWSNQWEPGAKTQHASDVYIKRFGAKSHSNKNIKDVSIPEIPDHDVLVGGFPCQDYSVARTLNQAAGIGGKKGVLWWEIYRILKGKKNKPNYLILENVDRLLKSPARRRGRDFAIMLASLSKLGYAVEWRVINAAEYGFPQQRRRIFIIGYYKTTDEYRHLLNKPQQSRWVLSEGVIAKEFPVTPLVENGTCFRIKGDLPEVSRTFNRVVINRRHEFLNSGLMIKRQVYTIRTSANYNGRRRLLGDNNILLNDDQVSEEYYVESSDLEKWRYLKGPKSVKRISKKTGHEYTYDEGSMTYPDSLDKPSRTIVTGEGGSTPSRFKHIIQTRSGRYRRLTPLELERLNGFPDDHTNIEGVTPIKRAFFMGNALVVGVVEKLGRGLIGRNQAHPGQVDECIRRQRPEVNRGICQEVDWQVPAASSY